MAPAFNCPRLQAERYLCCHQNEHRVGYAVKVRAKAAPRKEERQDSQQHCRLGNLFTDTPVPYKTCRHCPTFQGGIDPLGEERQQVGSADTDKPHSHREHRISNWCYDACHPCMRIPQDKRQVNGHADASRDNDPVNALFQAVVAQHHNHIERYKKPRDLLARQRQA